MRFVFLDTVGLLAVWNEADQWHERARPVYEALLVADFVPVTTSDVLAECANAAARRSFRSDVVALRRELEADERLIFPDEELWREAWSAYAAGAPGGPGLVDQLSIAVMRRYGLREVFSNDRHFRDAGLDPLF